MNTESKTFHCTEHNICVYYENSKKHYQIEYAKEKNSYINTSKIRIIKRYNSLQKRLYSECIYGLNYYNKDIVSEMKFSTKTRIILKHKKTEELINTLAWQKEMDELNKILCSFFKVIKGNVNYLLNVSENSKITERVSWNKSSINKIGGKDFLIKKMIEKGLLPENFFNLGT